MATTVSPYASRPLEIFYPKPIKGLGSFYFRRHEHHRARADLRDLCKLHKFSPKKCRNFVQYFSPKTIDFLCSIWYNIYVKGKMWARSQPKPIVLLEPLQGRRVVIQKNFGKSSREIFKNPLTNRHLCGII